MAAHFLDYLADRVVLCDGAMGTQVQARNLDIERDFLGNENCTEIVCESRPDLIREIHRGYLAAGCDAVQTNSFGGSPITLGEFGLANRAAALNRRAAEIAREAVAEFAHDGRTRFVLGSVGPGTRLPSLGHIGYQELEDALTIQCAGLIDGGVDGIIVETCQELGDGTGLPLRGQPVDLVWGLTMIAAGIGLHDTGIDGKPFALDQPSIHARPGHCLEQLPQDIAVAEAAVAIDREGRVVGHFVLEVETAEPAIGQMKLDLFAQLALIPDAVAVADNQHPQHQFGIDRRSTDLAIERFQLLSELDQNPRHDRIETAQEVVLRNAFFEVERIEQPTLIPRLPSHHHPFSVAKT